MPAPLRLIPRPTDPAADEAALVEAVLTGLPPGARVLLAGPPDGVATWLADALSAVDVEVVRTPLPETAPGALFDERPADPHGGPDGYDAVVVDAASLERHAAATLAALGGVLAPGGRLLVQAPADGHLSVGGWVRLLGHAGLVLRDVREPDAGGLAGSVFVAEAEAFA